MEWGLVLAYLVGPAVLTLLGAPIAALAFRPLPRRGAAFALPTALVPFAIAVFWIGQLSFGRLTVLLGVGVVFAGAVAALRRGADPDWRAVAAGFGVFLLGFALMVAVRAADPGITPAGGEQFLHFGLVNALARAETLPPEDMWFAGRELKYYYGTQLQVTSLSMLVGVPVRYGFNLGIATFYGLLVVVAYGVGAAVVARVGASPRLGGALCAFFVALAGHTTTPIRLLAPHLPEAVAGPVERAAFGFAADRFEGGDLAGTVAALSDPLEWSWWYERYVVPGTLQEVPLYSFVKADLHGHAFANGYVLFAGALGLAYYATPAAARTRRRGIVLGGLGAVAGLFGFMNTWSLPTAAGIAALAVAAADAHPATLLPAPWGERLRPAPATPGDRTGRVARELWRLCLGAAAGAAVLLVGVAVASPFLVFGEVPSNNGIGLLPPRSPLGPFLVVYGGLLAVFALHVADRGWPAARGLTVPELAAAGLLLAGTAAVLAGPLGFGVLAVLGPPLAAGWALVRSERGDYALVLLIAGGGLLLSLELVHARLPLIDHPRWNTSLKVAVQAWTLGAAGAGAAAALLARRHADRLVAAVRSPPASADGGAAGDRGAERGSPLRSAAVLGVVAVVLLASAAFPVMAIGAEVGGPTVEDDEEYAASLDGHHAAQRFHANEYEALAWLADRPGRPTIVEAPGPSYRWTSPAATFSGLPSVVGWDHQAEYRGQAAYDRRVARVDAIYAGEWPAAARNLRRYGVTYVYVGPNERERYGDGLRSFDRPAFSVAFESDAVTIYRVDRAELPPVGGNGSAAYSRSSSAAISSR